MPYTPTLPADLVFGTPWAGATGGPVLLDFEPTAPMLLFGTANIGGLASDGIIVQPIAYLAGNANLGGLAASGYIGQIATLAGNAYLGGLKANGATMDFYRGLAGGATCPFQNANRINHAAGVPWPAGTYLNDGALAPWGDAEQIAGEVDAGWKYNPPSDADPVSLAWADFNNDADHSLVGGWNKVDAQDNQIRLPYSLLDARDRDLGMAYIYPPEKDRHLRSPWELLNAYDRMTGSPWIKLHPEDNLWPVLPWGEGLPPRRNPFPPLPPVTQPEFPPYIDRVGGPIDLCFYEPASVSTDLVFRRRVACRDRGTIAMIHDLTLTRLPERTPVRLLAASLTISDGDIAWGARLILPDRDALDLIAPSVTGLYEVELTIDGHVWWLLVEGYEEDRRFGESAYSVSCRSPSAWLAAPYATPAAQNIAQAWTANQLADNAVAGLGWTIAWDLRYQGELIAFDWSVPAGAWRHDQLTPIEAVMATAEAAGGVVEPARAARELRVRYRHTAPRWDWLTAVPDVVIPASRILKIAGRYEPRADYDKVYVFGEQGGAAAGVTRQGYAGNKPAETIIDPLCTTIPVCTERGRQQLSAGGSRMLVTLEAPFGAGVSPIWPGYLAEVVEASTWRGVVTGLSINVQRDGEVIRAQQVAQLERAAV